MKSLVPRESAVLFCFRCVYAYQEHHPRVITQVRQPKVIFLLLFFPILSMIMVMLVVKEHQLNIINFAILFALEIRSLFKRMGKLAGFNSKAHKKAGNKRNEIYPVLNFITVLSKNETI